MSVRAEHQEPVDLAAHLPTPPISVVLYGGDLLTRAGVVAHIGHQRGIALLLDRDRAADGPRNGVALVLDDQLDAQSVTRLRKVASDHAKRVVLVVSELDEDRLNIVVEAGISSVVWRHQATPAGLVKAIQATARNEGNMPGDLLRRLLTHLERQAQGTALSTVATGRPTVRELNVLELVAHGLATKEIAEQLGYSERTIKGILHDTMTRLHLRNRAHAVAYVIREGYM
ncbi:LuxR C-terminal-related transcriptional regulator [Streptomyces sp. NPDC001822]|uniref:helix-turn-helix transcriptional regulator n=1 Tax=Streptomyces sp. NPDC001822 TaxID=3364614 RepID=UPI0036C20E86